MDGFERALDLLRLNESRPVRPTTFSLLGRSWELLTDVFAPVYSASTQTFASRLPYPVGGSLLEVGCGSGVISVMAAVKGCASVTALDISANAVDNTRRNAELHGVGEQVRVLHSDMFAAVAPEEKFDLIFWNSNFIEPPPGFEHHSEIARALLDPGYANHERYVHDAGRFLTDGGRLMLGFSTLGNARRLEEIVGKAGLNIVVLHVESHPTLHGAEYQLLELLPSGR